MTSPTGATLALTDYGCFDIQGNDKCPLPSMQTTPMPSDLELMTNSDAMCTTTSRHSESPPTMCNNFANKPPPQTLSTPSEAESQSPSCTESVTLTSSLPMSFLLAKMSSTEADISLAEHGYARIAKICDTLQGSLFKAKIIKQNASNQHYGGIGSLVAIKRTDKSLFHDKMTIDREESLTLSGDDGFVDLDILYTNFEDDKYTHLTVDEDVVKEHCILKYLTVQNQCTGDCITKFVDFFEDSSYYYLVMEWVEGVTLRTFMATAQSYLAEGKMTRKEYTVTVKFIMWQLVATLRWMHDAHNCVHLDLSLSNVMLTAIDDRDIFLESKEGRISINGNVSIKLLDFGVAEVYPLGTADFLCNKQCLSLNEYQNRCPLQLGENPHCYNAKAHDMWCVGHMLFQLMTGRKLYAVEDTFMRPTGEGGLRALYENQLKAHLKSIGLLHCFMMRSFSVLKGLLTVNETERMTAKQVTEHEWYSSYYHRKYGKNLNTKIHSDALKLRKVAEWMQDFPFFPVLQKEKL